MKLIHYKQWKTTTLGMMIILATIASVFIKEIQWSDAMIGMAAGLMLVFSPDTILDRITKLFMVGLLFAFSSCMSVKKLAQVCADKYPVKDSTIIIQTQDTTYQYIKGDSIRVAYYLEGEVVYKDTICPPVKVSSIVKTKEKIVYQENTAKSALFEIRLEEMTELFDAQMEETIKKLDIVNNNNFKLEEKIQTIRKHRNILLIILGVIILSQVTKYALKRWL